MKCEKLLVQFYHYFSAILIFICMLCGATVPKLILISMDGFRYDYLNFIPKNDTEHFQYIIENGVRAKAVMNVFPSNTYPNHYTMITGLYPESHGIVHNKFYDSVWDEYFDFASKRDNVDPFWYDAGAEPIYVTNKKAGGYSGSVVWPAGIGKVKGIGPDRLIPNANSWTEIDNFKRIDTLIEWFTDDINPINLALVYFLEPDEIAHKTGAGSSNVTDYIKGELNNVLGYLFKRLKEVNLFEEMNIIVTADHGFTNYSKEEAVVLSNYINSSLYKTGAENFSVDEVVHIFPIKGQEENVYNTLKGVPNLQVFRKGDPEMVQLHYSSSERIAPIVITASEGVVIFPDEESRNAMKAGVTVFIYLNSKFCFTSSCVDTASWNPHRVPVFFVKVGIHGYNPHLVPNMRPFFIAMGPAFKKGYVSEQFNSVDIYPLMCHILGVEPAPNNGSLEIVQGLLAKKDKSVMDELSLTMISFLMIVGLSATLAGIYAICACRNTRIQRRLLLLSNNRAPKVTSLESTAQLLLNSDDEDF